MNIRTVICSLLTALLLNTSLCLAEMPEEFKNVLPGYDIFQPAKIHKGANADWCLLGITYPGDDPQDGTALLCRVSNRWELAWRGGGVIPEQELYHLGVPIEIIKRFGYKLGKQEIQEIRASEPEWTDGTKTPLTTKEIALYRPWQLSLMLNEIYARHGYKFSDPFLKEYFHDRPWYRVDPNFSVDKLGEISKQNIALIQKNLASSKN